jgi:hypothetical protein
MLNGYSWPVEREPIRRGGHPESMTVTFRLRLDADEGPALMV